MMATTQSLLGSSTRVPQAAARPQDGAWLRLILAAAGLAALIAWGIWSETSADRPAGVRATTDQVAIDRAGAARYDGHGKWTGYMAR